MKPASIIIVLALFALFLLLGRVGGPANAIDNAIIAWLVGLRHASPGLTRAVIALTQLGSAFVTIGSALLGGGLLWRARERVRAKLLVGVVLVERLSADSIKLVYDRARPMFDLHPVVTNSSSYPSGHAANSMTAFVALALFAAPARLRQRAMVAAIISGILIGMTRPYLGVHWPSDVLGGWALAAIFLVLALELGRRLGAIEAQHDIVGGHRATIRQDEAAPPRLDGE